MHPYHQQQRYHKYQVDDNVHSPFYGVGIVMETRWEWAATPGGGLEYTRQRLLIYYPGLDKWYWQLGDWTKPPTEVKINIGKTDQWYQGDVGGLSSEALVQLEECPLYVVNEQELYEEDMLAVGAIPRNWIVPLEEAPHER